jgi:hypothetical protein
MITVYMDKITLICVTDFFWHFYAITQNTNSNDEDQPAKMIKNTLMKCMLDGVNNLVKVCTVAVY